MTNPQTSDQPSDYRQGLADGIAIVAYTLRYLDMATAANVADRAYQIAKDRLGPVDAASITEALRDPWGLGTTKPYHSHPAD